MADFSKIKVFKVQTLATDPYASAQASATWAAGNAMNTGRDGFSSFGIQTAAIAAAGYQTPTVKDETEQYDGTTWTEKGDVNTARRLSSGAGTTTAGIIFGGMTGSPAPVAPTGATETWNGSSWATSPASLNSARKNAGSAQQGTTTASLYFAGDAP